LDLPAGHYQVDWVETLEGGLVDGFKVDHRRGELELKAPRFIDDLALRILRRP
jgi:hypothetical protein